LCAGLSFPCGPKSNGDRHTTGPDSSSRESGSFAGSLNKNASVRVLLTEPEVGNEGAADRSKLERRARMSDTGNGAELNDAIPDNGGKGPYDAIPDNGGKGPYDAIPDNGGKGPYDAIPDNGG